MTPKQRKQARHIAAGLEDVENKMDRVLGAMDVLDEYMTEIGKAFDELLKGLKALILPTQCTPCPLRVLLPCK